MTIEANVIKLLQRTEAGLHRIRTGGARGTVTMELTPEQDTVLSASQDIIKVLLGDVKPKREARAETLASKAQTRAEKKAAKAVVQEQKAAERAEIKAAKAALKLQENEAKHEAKLAADAAKEAAKEAAKAAALEAKKAAKEAADKARKEMLAKFEANRTAIIGAAMPAIDPATATTPIRRTKTGIETASVPKGKMQAV